MASGGPVPHGQLLHPGELVGVVGDEVRSQGPRVGRDEKVAGADELPPCPEMGPDLGIVVGSLLQESEYFPVGQESPQGVGVPDRMGGAGAESGLTPAPPIA
jgi:hypothetical protein